MRADTLVQPGERHGGQCATSLEGKFATNGGQKCRSARQQSLAGGFLASFLSHFRSHFPRDLCSATCCTKTSLHFRRHDEAQTCRGAGSLPRRQVGAVRGSGCRPCGQYQDPARVDRAYRRRARKRKSSAIRTPTVHGGHRTVSASPSSRPSRADRRFGSQTSTVARAR